MIVAGIGLFVVAVVVGAFLVPGEFTTRAIAVLGFVVATGKTGYDVWDKERERRKKSEEGKERIKATPKFDNFNTAEPELGVVIYNDGTTPVHIESVVCRYDAADGYKPTEFVLFNLDAQPSELLQPKHTTNFVFGQFDHLDMDGMEDATDERLWIIVRSHGGGEWRIPGRDIAKVLGGRSRR